MQSTLAITDYSMDYGFGQYVVRGEDRNGDIKWLKTNDPRKVEEFVSRWLLCNDPNKEDIL